MPDFFQVVVAHVGDGEDEDLCVFVGGGLNVGVEAGREVFAMLVDFCEVNDAGAFGLRHCDCDDRDIGVLSYMDEADAFSRIFVCGSKIILSGEVLHEFAAEDAGKDKPTFQAFKISGLHQIVQAKTRSCVHCLGKRVRNRKQYATKSKEPCWVLWTTSRMPSTTPRDGIATTPTPA